MNLLPKSHKEFVSSDYWEQFFRKRGAKAFEWYGEYAELCGVLHKYMKPTEKILVVGCGNSQLSEDLYDVGYHAITNIDLSETVIRQMSDKNKLKREKMVFKKMDVTDMEYSDNEFGVALDKGTLDALFVDESDATLKTIEKLFQEISRVLRQGGRYICISLLQEHILRKVLEYFPNQGWPIRIHRIVSEADDETAEKEFNMPVFALVFTKFKKLPNMNQILEVCNQDDKIHRFETVGKLTSHIEELQQYAMIQHQIRKRSVAGEHISLSLCDAQSDMPRYTMYIVDIKERQSKKYAIFIVPQGREMEWMFSTDCGREQVAQSAGFQRLLVVTLHRNQEYQDLESIKAELSMRVLDLAPSSLRSGTQVPFLTIGNDIGQRVTVHKGCSDVSGEYVIEDVENDGDIFRRLVFFNNQKIIQSEAKMVEEKKRGKKKTKLIVDRSYLACQHHYTMVTALAFLDDFQRLIENRISMILVGLGGGGLPVFLHEYLPQLTVDVIDIDREMVDIAKQYFGFEEDETMKGHIEDGIVYIEQFAQSGKKTHLVLFDVDSKDVTVGMSCPPQQFVDPQFLHKVESILHPEGVFCLNLVCRDGKLRSDVLVTLEKVFSTVYTQKIEQEVNEIVFAFPQCRTNSIDFTNKSKGSGVPNSLLKNIDVLFKSFQKRVSGVDRKLASALQGLTLL